MTTHQDHVMAWLPFCLSRLDWFAKANPCNHSCQSWTFCADSPHFKRFKHFKLANISHFSKPNSTIWKPFVIGLTLTQITKETFEQESLLKLSFSQNSFLQDFTRSEKTACWCCISASSRPTEVSLTQSQDNLPFITFEKGTLFKFSLPGRL